MNDRIVVRAARSWVGTKTTPVEGRARPKQIRGNIDITPDELALALDMAREDRVEQDIRDYAHRKRTS
ncbi:hypothetical protein SEA_BAUER_47 [Arthrobacter phage Bauer]|uniref:Uncharacterized protein n=1 Tax=Arthrobacter phage Bauer TaxID=2985648 RepID=A0A9E7V2K4_9CAUD|nr:hypothetical protein QEO99_gp47 [Arthrobacter phage Bauer]UYM26596.1 hypothetical protein SEA_BAUER_47 [Arthrobacter phage Bauer]